MLQRVAAGCSVLQCVAVRGSVSQCVAVRCGMLQHVDVCCSASRPAQISRHIEQRLLIQHCHLYISKWWYECWKGKKCLSFLLKMSIFETISTYSASSSIGPLFRRAAVQYTHAQTNTHAHTHKLTHTHTHTQTNTQTKHVHTHKIRTSSQGCRSAGLCSTRIHIYTHIYVRTNTYVYMYINIYLY